MKKIFFSVLFLLLICIGIPASAAVQYGDLSYNVTNGKITITDCKTTASGELVIPSTISIWPVTSIGDNAFDGCKGLTSIIIPDSVTSIGEYGFANCHNLTSITIPDSVRKIGIYAFLSCAALTNVHITDMSAWCKISFDNPTSNPLARAANLYLNGSPVYDIVIPDTVTKIPTCAFYGYKNLTGITIADSVKSIDSSAFYGCSGLTEISTGNGVTNIKAGAFRDCTALTDVVIGNSVTDIGVSAFEGCIRLTNVTIGNSVTNIGEYAFYNCSRLTSITLPDSIETIGDYSFSNCSSLTTVYTPISARWSYDFEKTTSVMYLEATLLPVSVSATGSSYTYKVNVKAPFNMTGNFIICLYDNNRMVACKTHSIENKTECCVNDTLPSDTTATGYKVFLWNNTSSLIPLGKAVGGIIEQ